MWVPNCSVVRAGCRSGEESDVFRLRYQLNLTWLDLARPPDRRVDRVADRSNRKQPRHAIFVTVDTALGRGFYLLFFIEYHPGGSRSLG